jgi:hypothetical protein
MAGFTFIPIIEWTQIDRGVKRKDIEEIEKDGLTDVLVN